MSWTDRCIDRYTDRCFHLFSLFFLSAPSDSLCFHIPLLSRSLYTPPPHPSPSSLPLTVGSVSSCERLQKEKEEARLTFEETLQKLQEEHQTELTQLEERLRAFYSAEWDKTHQAYQEEANKCRALMQQQVKIVGQHVSVI